MRKASSQTMPPRWRGIGCMLLLAFGVKLLDLYRHGVAVYMDRILKGAKPVDLPVQQQPTFHLTINLKTAKALGVTIPPTLLFQASEVIQ